MKLVLGKVWAQLNLKKNLSLKLGQNYVKIEIRTKLKFNQNFVEIFVKITVKTVRIVKMKLKIESKLSTRVKTEVETEFKVDFSSFCNFRSSFDKIESKLSLIWMKLNSKLSKLVEFQIFQLKNTFKRLEVIESQNRANFNWSDEILIKKSVNFRSKSAKKNVLSFYWSRKTTNNWASSSCDKTMKIAIKVS